MLFGQGPRTDPDPMRRDETQFAFYDRCADPYFGQIRDLLETWLGNVPPEDRIDIQGRMAQGGEQFESALWELFLHECYRRSGFAIEFHPEVPDSPNRPDFRLSRDSQAFYLEAVRVGLPSDEIAMVNRREQVLAALDRVPHDKFMLSVAYVAVGDAPVSTKALRTYLLTWLDSLDPGEVARQYDALGGGPDALPGQRWEQDGWVLEFQAFPVKEEAYGELSSLLGAFGPGQAVMVDNHSGIRRVLDGKARRYGVPDLPLVIAVLSSTEYPTKSYEIFRSLYGAAVDPISERVQHPDRLIEDGFWITEDGQHNQHVPQVISSSGLAMHSLVSPIVWTAPLRNAADGPVQPEWLSRADGEVEPNIHAADPIVQHLGLPDPWPEGTPFAHLDPP